MVSTYTTICFGEQFAIRADFSQGPSQIFERDSDGEWQSTPYQVADFSHRPEEAMRCIIRDCIAGSGENPDEYETMIEAAIKDMIIDDDSVGKI